ncbi:MAG: hypothetical protein KAJ55_00200 [Anaerolineales bacterium]|nr:hypothetical protein [Anaerolineales bacterium]
MSGVRYAGPNNSTLFHTGCGAAVSDDQTNCPGCGEEVYPRSPRGRHESAMVKLYGREELRKMRAESDRRWARAARTPTQEPEDHE